MTLDAPLQDHLAYAREARPTEAEIAAVHRAARAVPPPRRRRRLPRRAAIIAAFALVVPAAALAASSVGDALTSFIGLSKSAALTLDFKRGTVIDENRGVAFTITRNDSDQVCLQLGGSVGICDDAQDDSWAQQLDDHAVAVIGTIPPRDADRTGPVPLFVLTSPTTKQVEVRYRTGPPSIDDVGRGGAVIAVDSDRAPQQIIARDRNGSKLGGNDITKQQWAWCYDEAGCAPQANK
jgi:hypothetical protein